MIYANVRLEFETEPSEASPSFHEVEDAVDLALRRSGLVLPVPSRMGREHVVCYLKLAEVRVTSTGIRSDDYPFRDEVKEKRL
jgi:hypothetical protein